NSAPTRRLSLSATVPAANASASANCCRRRLGRRIWRNVGTESEAKAGSHSLAGSTAAKRGDKSGEPLAGAAEKAHLPRHGSAIMSWSRCLATQEDQRVTNLRRHLREWRSQADPAAAVPGTREGPGHRSAGYESGAANRRD